MVWISFAHQGKKRRRFVKTMINILVQYNSGSFLTMLETISSSMRTLFHVVNYVQKINYLQ
jgi:hypothetical protein